LFPKSRVVVGFSGGIDSVCLLHLLKSLTEYELDLWALYVNHQLRPLENKAEIELLNRLGTEWGVHTRAVAINIPEKISQKQQSLQLIARQERYKAFEAFQKEVGAQRIALAHHQDDQVETVLYRIIRGTGPEGLAGMPVIRDQCYIRPLMAVSRIEIRQYVSQHQLNWIEDSSNKKLIYCRNRIRHQLLPELEASYNPRIKNGLLRLAQLAGEQSDFLEKLTEKYCQELIRFEDGAVRVRLEPFLQLHAALQYRLLKKALAKVEPFYQIESTSLIKIREKINLEKNNFKPVHIYKGIVVKVSENWIRFIRPRPSVKYESSRSSLSVPGVTVLEDLKLQVTIRQDVPPENWSLTSRNEVYVDADSLNLPLAIRSWKAGDSLRPLGAPGRQKLHDFYINAKVPRDQRNLTPLLVDSDDRIIWVMGYRLCEDFKVNPDTRRILRISIQQIE
ncbi:MAG TPA: tRNA lysidine(34) synthetase TilS, partial [Bacillota bacterium]|nr:tRNA lysidine(34) synthetase TilS [Bacillota bacterium]